MDDMALACDVRILCTYEWIGTYILYINVSVEMDVGFLLKLCDVHIVWRVLQHGSNSFAKTYPQFLPKYVSFNRILYGTKGIFL